jgi:hypothetical protein
MPVQTSCLAVPVMLSGRKARYDAAVPACYKCQPHMAVLLTDSFTALHPPIISSAATHTRWHRIPCRGIGPMTQDPNPDSKLMHTCMHAKFAMQFALQQLYEGIQWTAEGLPPGSAGCHQLCSVRTFWK